MTVGQQFTNNGIQRPTKGKTNLKNKKKKKEIHESSNLLLHQHHLLNLSSRIPNQNHKQTKTEKKRHLKLFVLH